LRTQRRFHNQLRLLAFPQPVTLEPVTNDGGGISIDTKLPSEDQIKSKEIEQRQRP
jgi:hypothetical protein